MVSRWYCDRPATPPYPSGEGVRFNLRVASRDVTGPDAQVTRYHLAPSVRVQLMGALLVVAGVVVVLVGLLVHLLGLPSLVLAVVMVLAAVAVVAGGWAVVRRRPVLTLDERGYRVGVLRSAGAREAGWRDVEDLVVTTLSGHDCVVLRLRDGRTTTVPVRTLDTPPDDLVRDLSAHLDRGHGYRRLRQ